MHEVNGQKKLLCQLPDFCTECKTSPPDFHFKCKKGKNQPTLLWIVGTVAMYSGWREKIHGNIVGKVK